VVFLRVVTAHAPPLPILRPQFVANCISYKDASDGPEGGNARIEIVRRKAPQSRSIRCESIACALGTVQGTLSSTHRGGKLWGGDGDSSAE
jgi:hypothetical protein